MTSATSVVFESRQQAGNRHLDLVGFGDARGQILQPEARARP